MGKVTLTLLMIAYVIPLGISLFLLVYRVRTSYKLKDYIQKDLEEDIIEYLICTLLPIMNIAIIFAFCNMQLKETYEKKRDKEKEVFSKKLLDFMRK